MYAQTFYIDLYLGPAPGTRSAAGSRESTYFPGALPWHPWETATVALPLCPMVNSMVGTGHVSSGGLPWSIIVQDG